MPSPLDLFKNLHEFLKTSVVFSSFPLSLLLIGLEALIDHHFSCPCDPHWNKLLTAFMFIGPALFSFFLMVLYLRPSRHGWFHCPEGVDVDNQQTWPKALISCLIPPAMWIFLLLLDGEYLACSKTFWYGDYVFDTERNWSWCKPHSDDYYFEAFIAFIDISQLFSYIWITIFSALAILLVCVYDCCISGKCDCCCDELLCFCRRRVPPPPRPTDTRSEGISGQQENIPLQEQPGTTSSHSTDPRV